MISAVATGVGRTGSGSAERAQKKGENELVQG